MCFSPSLSLSIPLVAVWCLLQMIPQINCCNKLKSFNKISFFLLLLKHAHTHTHSHTETATENICQITNVAESCHCGSVVWQTNKPNKHSQPTNQPNNFCCHYKYVSQSSVIFFSLQVNHSNLLQLQQWIITATT